MTGKNRKKGRGYSSKFVMVNKVTGEEVEGGIPVYVSGKSFWDRSLSVEGGYFVGFQRAFEAVSKDRTMTGETLRVWMYLMSRLGFENFIVLKRAEVSEELGMKGPHVSRAIAKLVDKELLIRGPKVGHSYAYRLNMDVAWKGGKDSYNENKMLSRKLAARELAKERWRVFEEVHAGKHEK